MNCCLLCLLSSEETSWTWELGQNTVKEEDKDKSTALMRSYDLTPAGRADSHTVKYMQTVQKLQ